MNPSGEVQIKAGNETYTLRLRCNELVALQHDPDLAYKGDDEGFMSFLGAKLDSMSPVVLRLVLHRALKAKHADVDLDKAGEILSDAGSEKVVLSFLEAIRWSLPTPKAEEEKKPGKEDAPSPGATS